MATRKSKSRSKPKAKITSGSKARASWKGNISFGLVAFAVEAFNAIDREQSDIHFNQLHEKCHRRIKYQKVCPVHGEVTNDEIVSGYEYKKGAYVEIAPEELDALRSEKRKTLKVDAFITPETIDPIYYDGRMYYLMPVDDGANEAYSVFLEAMEKEGCQGVGQLVFSGKEQIVVLRPYEGVLHMAMLNYEREIKPPRKVSAAVAKSRGLAKELKLAQSLIAEWTEKDFDFSQYEDDYRQQVEKLIEAKISGKEIVVPEEPKEEPEIVNLMEALKRSLAKSKSGGNARKGKSRRRSA